MSVELKTPEDILGLLKRALGREYACIIRYVTHACVLVGPGTHELRSYLKLIARDEQLHAAKLRNCILEIGGTPPVEVAREDPGVVTSDPAKILDVDVNEEERAVQFYRYLLETVGPENGEIYDAIEDILDDEEEHLRELRKLKE